MNETTLRSRLELRDAGSRGRGVFTTTSIGPGELVLTFEGPQLRRDQVEDFTHVIQVGVALFLGPSGGLDDFVNHSCAPNCRLHMGFRGPSLSTLHAVPPGEEVTFDYSTCMVEEPSIGPCRCGAASCRGVIEPFWSLTGRQRRELGRRGLAPPFLFHLDDAG